MGGRSSRLKGHNFEREVARLLREVYGAERVRRGLQSQGGIVPDVIIDDIAVWIECKRGKKTNIKAAMRQADADKDAAKCEYYSSLVITKDDREEALATLKLTDLLMLMAQLERLGKAYRGLKELV